MMTQLFRYMKCLGNWWNAKLAMLTLHDVSSLWHGVHKDCPVVHQCATALEYIAPVVGRLRLIDNLVSHGHLAQFGGVVGAFSSPVDKGRSKTMRHSVYRASLIHLTYGKSVLIEINPKISTNYVLKYRYYFDSNYFLTEECS